MHIRRNLVTIFALIGLLATACGGKGGATTGPDLEVERQIGYAVIVENRVDGLSIGFSTDRDAEAGEEYDVSQSMWRIEDGPWIEPPVSCLGKGQRIELGISQVENEARPGLLKDRVVWVSCLAPDEG
jgi:hypothetical protein